MAAQPPYGTRVRAFFRSPFSRFPLHPPQGRLQWGHEERNEAHHRVPHPRLPVPHQHGHCPHSSPHLRLTPSLLHTTIQTWITPPTTPLTFPTTSTLRGMRRSSVMSIMKPPMLTGGKAHMGLLMTEATPSEVRQA